MENVIWRGAATTSLYPAGDIQWLRGRPVDTSRPVHRGGVGPYGEPSAAAAMPAMVSDAGMEEAVRQLQAVNTIVSPVGQGNIG